MPDGRTDAGFRPGGRPTFCGQKVGKEPDPTAASPSLRYGANLRHLPLVAVRQNSLRAFGTPFKQVAAELITMRLHSSVQPPATRGRRRRPGQKGKRAKTRDSFSIKIDSCYRLINKH